MFFPVRDDNPMRGTRVATIALIAINVAAWTLVQGFGLSDERLAASVCKLGAIPGALLGTVPPGTTVDLGGYVCALPARPDWATVLTSMFMHGSWPHILGNMWFLWLFGDNVEDVMGHARFALFYLLCGVAAFAAQAFADSHSALPMVGASGAIGGVLGAYARLYPRARVHVVGVFLVFVRRFVVPAAIVLGMWFVMQVVDGALASPAAGGVAFWAHVGGFLTGLAGVGLFVDPRRARAAHGFPPADDPFGP